MRMMKTSEFQVRSENQLNHDLSCYLKELEKARPLSEEWYFLKHMINRVQAEQSRRYKRMQPRF